MASPSPRAITSLLWRSQRIYQVFGANTDVGKTIFTTLLCNAARARWANETVTFLKPVSTGPDDEADDRCKSSLPLPLPPSPLLSSSWLPQHDEPRNSAQELTAQKDEILASIFFGFKAALEAVLHIFFSSDSKIRVISTRSHPVWPPLYFSSMAFPLVHISQREHPNRQVFPPPPPPPFPLLQWLWTYLQTACT